jgi:hypothetical protein
LRESEPHRYKPTRLMGFAALNPFYSSANRDLPLRIVDDRRCAKADRFTLLGVSRVDAVASAHQVSPIEWC